MPNPFAHRTVIAFDLPAAGLVRLAVYDQAGKHVKTLTDESLSAGPHARIWDRTDANGGSVEAGIYVMRLTAETMVAEEKLVVLP